MSVLPNPQSSQGNGIQECSEVVFTMFFMLSLCAWSPASKCNKNLALQFMQRSLPASTSFCSGRLFDAISRKVNMFLRLLATRITQNTDELRNAVFFPLLYSPSVKLSQIRTLILQKGLVVGAGLRC